MPSHDLPPRKTQQRDDVQHTGRDEQPTQQAHWRSAPTRTTRGYRLAPDVYKRQGNRVWVLGARNLYRALLLAVLATWGDRSLQSPLRATPEA